MPHESEMNWRRTFQTIGLIWGFIAVASAIGVLLIMLLADRSWALTHYAGEWDNVDPAVRSWFRNVRSPHGVPCCDMADGHRTLEDIRANAYWIPDPAATDGLTWIQVPPEAVVYDSRNPTGEAVVWYVMQGPNQVYIRCFVPGGGV